MKVRWAGKPAAVSVDRTTLSAALRAQVFSIKPTELEVAASSSGLYGVVLDTALSDEVVTLVVLTDGSVSLYVTDGSGCIGCGAHPEVSTSAATLLRVAESVLPESQATANKSLPPPNSVRCFFLTREGLRTSQATLQSAHRNDSALGALYVAGLHLLQIIERSGAGHSLQAEIELASRDRAAVPTSTRDTQPCMSAGNAARRLRT